MRDVMTDCIVKISDEVLALETANGWVVPPSRQDKQLADLPAFVGSAVDPDWYRRRRSHSAQQTPFEQRPAGLLPRRLAPAGRPCTASALPPSLGPR